mgnify:CR=1 FL=1
MLKIGYAEAPVMLKIRYAKNLVYQKLGIDPWTFPQGPFSTQKLLFLKN